MNHSKSTIKNSTFPRYERYKDSGVEWLGEVPDHWAVERVFSVFNERVETGNAAAALPNLNITIGRGVQVEENDGARKKRLIEDLNAYKRAKKGDIAYNTMRMWQGAVGDVPVDGLVSPAYVVARPIKPINSRFYSYLFRTETFQTETNRHSYGIVSDRNRLYWLGFKNIVLPIPSLADQDRIVAFLDRKTAEIDTLIAKKQRQIELLDEQIAILINRAVTRGLSGIASATKGLNPNAKLKPSGIEWIGDIPDHWEVTRNRRIFSEKSRKITNPDELPLSLSQVDGVIPSKDMKERSLSPAHRDNFKLCLAGDLVLNRFKAHLGVFFASNYRGVVTFHYGVYEPLCALNSKYFELLYHTGAYCTIYAGATNGMSVGLQNLSNNNFYEIKTLFPPPSEQDAIVQFSENVAKSVASVVESIERLIAELRKLRSTLIAHAVTGKIKV